MDLVHPAPGKRRIRADFGLLTMLAILVVAGTALVHAQSPAGVPQFTPAQLEFFEREVRPILAENCFKCHGPDEQKGGLRTDSRQALLAGGDTGPAVVPGEPDDGYLVGAVSYGDLYQMPPTGKLPDEQIETLKQWISDGAPWPPEQTAAASPVAGEFNLLERAKHWSFQPLGSPTIPAVEVDWPLSPVDNFVLADMKSQGLFPTSPADKRTLLRRATFDLIGLPPTPEEFWDFLADDSAGAFPRVVERLLASPHYGERWGRHWLDLVRYAETCGHEFDYDLPGVHHYRDYVIRSLNADLPYDQFVTEHIAGDLLPAPRRHPADGSNESILGTAFYFLGEAIHSPVDVREDECKRIDNQIDVLSKAFLGLGVACARCHDHKFDAITTADYYALSGYLRRTRYQEAFIDDPQPIERAAADLALWQEKQRQEILSAALRDRLERIAQLAPPPGSTDAGPAWAGLLTDDVCQQPAHLLFPLAVLSRRSAVATPTAFAELRRQLHAELSEQSQPAADESLPLDRAWFTGPAFQDFTGSPDIHWSSDPANAARGAIADGVLHSGRTSDVLQGVARTRTFKIERPQIWYRVAGRAGTIRLIVDGFQRIQDPIYGGLKFDVDHGEDFAWHSQDVSMWIGQSAYVEIADLGSGFVAVEQIALGDAGPPPAAVHPASLALLADSSVDSLPALSARYVQLFDETLRDWIGGSPRSPDQAALTHAILRLDRMNVEPAEGASPELVEWAARRAEMEAAIPVSRRALAAAEGDGLQDRILVRGNHKTPGEPVRPRFLEALTGAADPDSTESEIAMEGSGRLELARQMTDPAINPLLPRVIVNRLWAQHFGRGLAATPDDLGRMGEAPTHPELLDWLGRELIANGWSLKHMHRLMMVSRTYQMASQPAPEAAQQDPANRWLSHMPVRRLEAEAIRDSLLAVSGGLSRAQLGPGVAPYLTPFMAGRGRPAQSGPLDGDRRRSIYLAVRRNFLAPMFLAFDYPQPFTAIGRRSASNVPSQALVMMNNPFVAGEARRWSARLISFTPDVDQRIAAAYEQAFGRPPEDRELRAALAFVREQQARYAGDEANAGLESPAGPEPVERAWSDLCHVLFNVKEFIYIP